MLTDLAARKLTNDSPCTSPKHHAGGYDVTDNAQYIDNGKLLPIFPHLVTGFDF